MASLSLWRQDMATYVQDLRYAARSLSRAPRTSPQVIVLHAALGAERKQRES